MKRLPYMLLALLLSANVSKAVDVDTFVDLNSAVQASDAATFLNDIEAAGNINAQGQTILTIDGDGYTLDGKGYIGFIVRSGQTLNLENIFIENFKSVGNGGAIHVQASGNLNIGDGVIFSNNTAGTYGGVFRSERGSIVNIGDNVTFIGNQSGPNNGGATYTIGATLTIGDYVKYINNKTPQCGALYNYDSVVRVGDYAQFIGNEAGQGGAIAAYLNANTTIIGDYAQFINNKAIITYGGAIATWEGVGDIFTIGNHALFSGNESVSMGGAIGYTSIGTFAIGDYAQFINNKSGNSGGAIGSTSNGGTINIGDYAQFVGNEAAANGGAIGSYTADKTINIGNNAQFIGNKATGAGGAINVSAGTVNIVSNTAFLNNTAAGGGAIALGGTVASPVSTVNFDTTGGTTVFSGNIDSSGKNDILLRDYATVNIGGTGTMYLDGGITSTYTSPSTGVTTVYTNNKINKTDSGELILAPGSQNHNFKGEFNQTGGTTTVYGTMFGGSIYVSNNSTLNVLTPSSNISMENLSVSNATVNTRNGARTNFNVAGDINIQGVNNFYVDSAERFNATGNLTGVGTINVSSFNVIDAPTNEVVTLQLFNASNIDSTDVKFTQSVEKVSTAIYDYSFTVGDSLGQYNLVRGGFNKEVFRGQAATLAAYQNQLVVNNALFDHIFLDSESNTNLSMINKYAAGTEIFAPYQYSRTDGGVWMKAYTTLETLAMTQGLNIDSTAYGSIVGVDLPALDLKRGWKFLPTGFVAYNGGHQTFSDVSMFQNGGQGGLMGTFMKNDFISSILAYGGGYNNQMSLEGTTDRTGNWFAGASTKSAYNFHPTKNLIIQPTALVSYNIFGKQNWGSDFGAISMNSGLLNGINVAPGLNFIYGRKTWNLYATTQYMFNINDNVNGSAASVDLPNIKMRHGYFEYGFGATKTFKERLLTYVQIILRNGGRTGVGFQAGLNWKL